MPRFHWINVYRSSTHRTLTACIVVLSILQRDLTAKSDFEVDLGEKSAICRSTLWPKSV